MNLCFRLLLTEKIFTHLEYIIRRRSSKTKTLEEYNTRMMLRIQLLLIGTFVLHSESYRKSTVKDYYGNPSPLFRGLAEIDLLSL
jgi:hypothetical protein